MDRLYRDGCHTTEKRKTVTGFSEDNSHVALTFTQAYESRQDSGGAT